jgi:adenosylmethionine-8-amino-7-oxononanoate aminotransferase
MLQWDREHITHGRWPIGDNIGIVTEHAEGIRLQDTEGKWYIDGASQLICCNLGYGQQEIIDAIQEEMARMPYGMLFHGFSNRAIIECGQRLGELLPDGQDHFSFNTGGSEGNDTAVKLARLYWNMVGSGKRKIVSLYDSYHGITSSALSATGSGKGAYERGIGPGMPGFIHIPSYYCYRCSLGLEYPSCDVRCARFLGEVIEKEGADQVAAFIVEPVLGVGGMVAPVPQYFPIIRDICRKYDVLLISDEVMTGFCRTGTMFGTDNWDITPDMSVFAKGITSAYLPFGAVAFSQAIWDAVKGRNFVAHTYSGHPVCAVAATKAMEIYVRDGIAAKAAAASDYALERLRRDFLPLPCVGGADGLGLMLGIEIVADKASKRTFDPALGIMQGIQDKALENGLFVRVSGTGGTPSDRVVFAPPLVITNDEIDEALDILQPILAAIEPR